MDDQEKMFKEQFSSWRPNLFSEKSIQKQDLQALANKTDFYV
jgi:hypothetical protein